MTEVNAFGKTWYVWQHKDSRFSRRLTVQETDGERRLGIEFSAPSSLCGLMSCDARTLEEAVGKVVASSLRTRMGRGGPNWRPEQKPAEASA